MATISEQIREMLSNIEHDLTENEALRLDRIMQRQREKHGAEATAWWFDAEREKWLGREAS